MRILAVIANLAQVGIVLAIFIRLGLDPGGWVIGGLFCLLIVALLNQIVVFSYAVNKAVHHPLIGVDHQLSEREDLRVTYPMAPQPTAVINEKPFSVLDLAENGMRLLVGKQQDLKKQVNGRISLLSGRSFSFHGSVVRREGDVTAIVFSQPMDPEMLEKESRLLQGL